MIEREVDRRERERGWEGEIEGKER
jgi:hypothetical protein